MKRFFIIFTAILIALVVVAFLFSKKTTETLRPVEEIQAQWNTNIVLALGSPDLEYQLDKLIFAQSSGFEREQAVKLSIVLQRWFKLLSTGKYEDYLAFRRPDAYAFNARQLQFVSKVKYKDPTTLEKYPDDQKLKELFDYFNTITFDGIRANTLAITNFYGRETKEIFSPFSFYSGGAFRLHASSSVRYSVTPDVVLEKYNQIRWVIVQGAFYTEKRPDFSVALQLALYWSPSDSSWKPADCYMASLGRRGDPEPDPTLYY